MPAENCFDSIKSVRSLLNMIKSLEAIYTGVAKFHCQILYQNKAMIIILKGIKRSDLKLQDIR